MSSSTPPTPFRSGSQHDRKRPSNASTLIPTARMLVLVMFSAVVGFYAGLIVGGETCALPSSSQCNCNTKTPPWEMNIPAQTRNQGLFDPSISDFVVGAARVNRDDFAAKYVLLVALLFVSCWTLSARLTFSSLYCFHRRFDTGGPLDPSISTNSEVLILYSHPESLPKHQDVSTASIPLMSVDNATDTCDYLNIVLTQQSRTLGQRRQCIAIMGQYESFHIQRFMRLPQKDGEPIQPDLPLRLVPRTAVGQRNFYSRTIGPEPNHTNQYWSILTKYLSSLDSTLARLRPIVKSIAVKKTVVVLVCNHGQSELLINFICNARRRGLDLTPVLVFATDPETRDLAQGLGLASFYDEINYREIPRKAAGEFGDSTFGAIVLAKIYCVQMISMLGYDILFQDVDVMWYRSPLEFFHNLNSSMANYDIYFQDDGNRGYPAYSPYCANSGFYYVRNNQKTRNLLNNYLMSGDFVLSSRNDQHVLSQLLQEHASLFGLRVKTLHDTLFPTGFAYHLQKNYMKGLISGDQQPYVFHMSWTTNKTDKIRYYQQMGEWFVVDTCIESTAEQIRANRSLTEQASGFLISSCCSAEAIFRCHYRDKPSKIPCHDSPVSSWRGSPFW
jgi:hypothetical protein